MHIKFDIHSKKSFGNIMPDNKEQTVYVQSTINIDVNHINKMEVVHAYNNEKNTDIVELTRDGVNIPFNRSYMNTGLNRFMLKAYMNDGSIKTSQTCVHEISDTSSRTYELEYSEYTVNDIRVQPIVVDMDSVDPIVTPIKFKQYDFGTCNIVLQLYDNNRPLKLKNINILVSYKNPRNNILFDTISYDIETSVVSDVNGIIKISVPNDALRYVGTVEFEVMLIDADYRRSTTPTISFGVVRSIADHEEEGGLVDDDRYSFLTALINDVGVMQESVVKLIDSTTIVKDETVVVKNNTESVRVATDSIRVQAENKIKDCETRMKTIEDTFDDLVDGTGMATTGYVDGKIDVVNIIKANKDDVYSKDETTTLLSYKASINDSTESTSAVWSSKKTKDMINDNSPTMPDGGSMVEAIVDLQNEVGINRNKLITEINNVINKLV